MPGEVPGTVLEPVVVGQEDRGAVADSVLAVNWVYAYASTIRPPDPAGQGRMSGSAVTDGPRDGTGRVPRDAASTVGLAWTYLAGLTSIFLTSSFFSALRPTETVRMPWS